MGAIWDRLEQHLGGHLNPCGESVKFIPAQQSQNLNQDLIRLTIAVAADIDRVMTELKLSVLCLGSKDSSGKIHQINIRWIMPSY